MPTNRLDFKTPEDEINLLYGIINSFKDAVVVLNPALKVIFLNKTAKLLYGLELSQQSSDLSDQAGRLFFPDHITPCALSELPFLKANHPDAFSEIELYVQRPDGTGIEVSATRQPLPCKDDDAPGWLVTLADISPQKQREHELRRRTEQLKLIIDMIPMPIFVKDADSRFIIINKASEEQWGCSSQALLDTDGSQFFPAEQTQEFLAKDREAWESESLIANEEFVWSDKLKENRFCVTLKTPIFDNDGTPLYLIGISEDITERRHAENSLRATLASLRAVFDNLPFFAWMKDREGRYILVNKHWSQAVGLDDPINLNGLTDYDIWPKELAEHYRLADQQVMATRQQVLLTEKALDEGRETWTETIKAPIIDDENQVLGTTGIARDITERLSAEQQLHKFSERLRLASKAAAIGICEWDVNTGLADWDERNYEIFGIPQGTSIDYRAWAALVFPDDLPNATIKLRKLLNKKQEIHWEFRIHRQSDGALRYIKASAIPACKPNGEVHKIIGVNLDVTDYKQIEIELDEKRAHLSEAQALANLGSWSLDFNTNEITWSDEKYRIFGIAVGTSLSYESFLGKVHPDDRAFVDDKWTAAFQGEALDIQHRILVDGKVKWVRERADIEFTIDGRLLRVVGTSQDITELKLVESDLEASRLQLRQLAARRERTREEERKRIARDIHDDLGQMLTSLRMEISLLRMNFAGDNLQLLEKIHSLTRLLDKTIQVTREVATKLRPTVIEMGIGPALEWLVKTTSLQSGIEFDIYYTESDLDMDEGVAIVIFRIVQESLNNVLKHAQASRITLSLQLDADNYFLEINDNGTGFDSTTPRKANSLGLLGIQERAIMLGGEAIITSSQGKGTLVLVRIPVDSAEKTR